jgi:hypothetical protein
LGRGWVSKWMLGVKPKLCARIRLANRVKNRGRTFGAKTNDIDQCYPEAAPSALFPSKFYKIHGIAYGDLKIEP